MDSISISGNLFTWGRDTRYILYPDNVVFYHAVDDYIEHTLQEPWQENVVHFSGGLIVSGVCTLAGGDIWLAYDNQYGGYPKIDGATSIGACFWTKGFFKSGPVNSTMFIGNNASSSGLANSNGLHLHGILSKPNVHIDGNEGKTIGQLDPQPDDDEWHFVVIYAEMSGGNWQMYGSVDGNPMDHLTNDNLSTTPMEGQRYFLVNFVDENGGNPPVCVDEIVCWVGLDAPFTDDEILGLYRLGSFYGETMDRNLGYFYTGNEHDLFIHGRTSHIASGDLFIYGHVGYAGSCYSYIQGHIPSQASGALYIDAYDVESGSMTLTIHGHESRPLYITGYDNISGQYDLFTVGHILFSGSNYLFTHGHLPIETSCDMFVYGYIIDVASGSLFIHGHIQLPDSNELFIYGRDNASGSNNLFVHGHRLVHSDDGTTGPLPQGHEPAVGPLGVLYILGSQRFIASGNLFIDGSGIIPHSGSLDLFINGIQPKPALSCPILDPTASIQIKDSLIRIYQSRIDALINQLGKNVYLEFDPIKGPCPNCENEMIRGRSRGIYRTGGPRPFARGRKCPHCKGRGFEETPVNKCIKCLIKWNPEDAKNFGIAVSQTKGVVRFKTYLTEADDLSRARTAIANKDISDQMKLRVKLIQGPIPVGLREDRYCISFWELI